MGEVKREAASGPGRGGDDDALPADGALGDGLEASDAPSVDPGRFREVLGHFVTGVTIVTAMEEDGPVGFTCQAFTSLSLEPPLVALAPGKSSTSWPRIAAAGAFCVNILAEDQEALGRDFAVSGGDKFRGVGWRPGGNGSPVIDGVLAWVECTFVRAHDAGDHELVVGLVQDMGVRAGRPLVYYRGGFGRFEP
ncbi:MAG: flavin reductase family protein [Acidimicrobiales bacterium]|jgi:flavin reductase (DIM6/NTAB) family NADH-FMN oxidoreductase RutF